MELIEPRLGAYLSIIVKLIQPHLLSLILELIEPHPRSYSGAQMSPILELIEPHPEAY
jgi:hypothetical protein